MTESIMYRSNRPSVNFAAGLRSLLRHDPDVILIGEIRDKETGPTLFKRTDRSPCLQHSPHQRLGFGSDAAGRHGHRTVPGLGHTSGVLAQRLVRKLCIHCRKATPIAELDVPSDFPVHRTSTVYVPQGCVIAPALATRGKSPCLSFWNWITRFDAMAISGSAPHDIERYAIGKGMQSMRQAGWDRVWKTLLLSMKCCVVPWL